MITATRIRTRDIWCKIKDKAYAGLDLRPFGKPQTTLADRELEFPPGKETSFAWPVGPAIFNAQIGYDVRDVKAARCRSPAGCGAFLLRGSMFTPSLIGLEYSR